jgi:hypothetical protein
LKLDGRNVPSSYLFYQENTSWNIRFYTEAGAMRQHGEKKRPKQRKEDLSHEQQLYVQSLRSSFPGG